MPIPTIDYAHARTVIHYQVDLSYTEVRIAMLDFNNKPIKYVSQFWVEGVAYNRYETA